MAKKTSALKILIDSLPDPDERGLLSNIDKQAVDDIIAQIHEGGRGSLVALIDMLVEPGAGDDVKARYALHCLAVHVCRLDNNRTQRAFTRTLASQLGGDRPKAVQRYIIQQLQVAGGKEVVPALGKMLLDGQLYEPAAQALTAIGDGAAEQFRNALARSGGKMKLTIIQNLGVLRDAKSAGQLKAALDDEDREIRLAAGWALANMADSGSTDLLLRAAETDDAYERIKATKACLLLAESFKRAGRKGLAAKIYEHLRDTRNGSDEAYVRDAASEGLATVGRR
ncbi:MAG: HEAT repeat domain-containing protein [Phycisphaerales bacterium]|nr:MAG: HEAT repeat domain-containing protein [Phycisphaerales bacterium]